MEERKRVSIAEPDDNSNSFVAALNPKQVERPAVKQLSRRTSATKLFARTNPDDPVPADSYTSCKLDEPVKLQMSDKGALAQKPMTVMTALQMTADRYHDQDAFAVRVDGKWQKTKLRDMCRTVRTVAKGFLQLGLVKFHGVGIMGYNSPEWIISCLAAINAGGVAVGINYRYSIEDCKRVALMAQCNIIVVDSAEDLEKILEIRSSLPDLQAIVQYGKNGYQKTAGVFSWDKLLVMGEKAPEDKLKERILSLAPNYCCLVAFTSGRTGPPKPVMLSHDNAIWQATVFGRYQSFSKSGGTHMSFQPLTQPIGMLLDIFIPLVYATTVYFLPRKLFKHKFVEILTEVRPTFFASIPFFFERLADRLQLAFEGSSAIKKIVFNWSMNIGRKTFRNAMEGKPRPFGWWLANQLVFKGIQRKLGLDRCIEVHSSVNLMLPRTAEFFTGLNRVILSDWGNSETTGPHVVSRMDRHRLGACGVEMDGCSTKFVPIDKTTYTEIRVKGRHVFMGYLNEPQMTADAFDEDGWYKTGDMGYRDESGFVWFVGSIYGLCTLSDGHTVSPLPIERQVKNLLPCVGTCFAYGHNKPYIVMLLTLDLCDWHHQGSDRDCNITAQCQYEGFSVVLLAYRFLATADEETEIPTDVLSKRAEIWLRTRNVSVSAISKMAENPPEKLVSIIQAALDKVNSSVPDNPFAIRKWKFLPRDFSFKTGELTAAYREKRSNILDFYSSTIESLYTE